MSILQQLLEGADLPIELVEKAETLFEAAVTEKVNALVTEKVTEIKAQHKTLLEQEVKVQKRLLQEAHDVKVAELESLVESTLQKATLEWAEENKVGLDSKIKVQLAESFIQNIAGVMVDTFIQQGDTSNVFTTLGPKERQILQLLSEGHSSKEIAAHLDISVKTVEAKRSQIMEKLNLYSVAELTKYAVREGLTSLH